MDSRCKAGDLALLLRNVPGCVGGAGRFVLVGSTARDDPALGLVWPVLPITTAGWDWKSGIRPLQVLDRPHWLEQPDAWMMPLGVPPDAIWYEGSGAFSDQLWVTPITSFEQRQRLANRGAGRRGGSPRRRGRS
jgi:hypothetical protein